LGDPCFRIIFEKFLCCGLVSSLCNKAFKNFAFVINSAPQVKMFFHLFSQKLHSGAITSLNVALLYSYGFLARTLTQT